MKLLAKNTWKNADPLMKAQLALAPVGIGAALMAPKDAPNKGEQVGASLGNVAGAVVGSALPFGAGQIAMAGASRVGQGAGKAVDWLRGRRGPEGAHTDASELATNEGQHMPSQRDVNPSVSGSIR